MFGENTIGMRAAAASIAAFSASENPVVPMTIPRPSSTHSGEVGHRAGRTGEIDEHVGARDRVQMLSVTRTLEPAAAGWPIER